MKSEDTEVIERNESREYGPGNKKEMWDYLDDLSMPHRGATNCRADEIQS